LDSILEAKGGIKGKRANALEGDGRIKDFRVLYE